ncbi:MAG: hypothetical protein ACRCTZ_08045 [Sarcina sp.]
MDKNQKKIFEEYCYSYANRFLLCMSSETTPKYIKIFSKSHYWRIIDDLEFKHKIEISEDDDKIYKQYEKIMIEVLTARVEELAKNKNVKEKEDIKKHGIKRKKGN